MAEKDLSLRFRRAVKENNLFLVKRLLSRSVDLRNVDPASPRYTSLAWAAILGHEETFDFLLSKGHDDEELSKDAENNTILILLAGLRLGINSPYNMSRTRDNLQEAALRMARSYYERFPFILDWSNVQGKTALHMASQNGNEDFAAIIKLLIERGCRFAARNNEGYTAVDYAYSNHTKETLEDSGRAAHDARRNARRPPYAQMKAVSLDEDRHLPNKHDLQTHPRIRSGSGTTTTSESADDSAIHTGPMSLSSSSSISSSQPSGTSSSSSNRRTPPRSQYNSSRRNNYFDPVTKLNATGSHPHSILTPVASRVLASDAGARAEYMKRNRSASQGETLHVIEPASSHAGRGNSSKGSISEEYGIQKHPQRRLRPSMSAAALNQPSTVSTAARFRAGTNPSNLRPAFSAATRPSVEAGDVPDRFVSKRGVLPSLKEPRNEPPGKSPPVPPPKDSNFFHQRGPSS
ncbi:hypothetical protein Clacol_001688 [Clathrus columnatus]|uniref:Ankyrin n=1 Tax=Clathrus columnatus TaxID=1419009 RepID=A0AAV4ZYT3_9AGAM|nr:hypothetical protein Clacol_001688 [Clathrus columnatus]